jgi:hypothetical protein
MVWAIVAIVLSAAVLIVALALWFVAMILPVVLAMGLIAWLAFRYQLWRTGGSFVVVRRGPTRR